MRRLYAAAALGGLLIAACFLRFGLFPLAWFAFVPILWALDQAPGPREARRLGFVAGVGTNLPAFWWLVYTIHVFGGFPWIVAVLLYLLLTALTSLQFVVLATLLRRTGPGPVALAAPLLWVSLEFLFPLLFPWRMAHSQMPALVLLQSGELAGPYLLSFTMVWFSAAVAGWIAGRGGRPVLAAVALAGLLTAFGAWRLPQIDREMAAAPSLRVGLVQGNVGIVEKGEASFFEVNLGRYRRLSDEIQERVDLLVWPETVHQRWLPADLTRLEGPDNPYADLQTHLVFGGLAYRHLQGGEGEEFNSAFLLGPEGRVLDRYDKRILMPFGEYIPGGSYFPAVYALSPGTGKLTAGREVRLFDIAGKGRVGQLICFEDIVASMPRETTRAGADVLVTILNDAWYGDSAAPYQHQALALWRTVENRRFLLRGSNTGVTSILDAAGRVVAQGGLFTEEVVLGEVRRLSGETLYTRFGDWFAWLCGIASGAILAWRRESRA